jgi:hypothetical protein
MWSSVDPGESSAANPESTPAQASSLVLQATGSMT